MAPLIVLLLDNHHGPCRRAQWLSSILRTSGARVRIVAWDRRPEVPAAADPDPPTGEEVVRIRAAAAWGAGSGTLKALAGFWLRVLARRAELLDGADALIASDLYLLPLGAALRARTGMPLIYDAREDWAALEAARRPRRLRQAVTRAETALARTAAAVVVPGRSRMQRWQQAGIDPVVLRNVGTPAPREDAAPRWDVATVGLLAEQRRPDLFLSLAAQRPDLRFVIAGGGRLEPQVRAAAQDLPNVDYQGFVRDIDAVLAATSVIVYGEDPSTPYSRLACPNTLYQAVGLRRPLVFYCAGEPEETAQRFHVGIRCRPQIDELSTAVDAAIHAHDWQFDEAWTWLSEGAGDAFASRMRALVPGLTG